MKNLIKLLFLLSAVLYAQTDESVDDQVEEVVVKGNVLYSDQVNALKTPVPVLDVPQTVTIVTDDDIRSQGLEKLAILFVIHLV